MKKTVKNTEIVLLNACIRSSTFNIHADLYYGIENIRRNEDIVMEEEEFKPRERILPNASGQSCLLLKKETNDLISVFARQSELDLSVVKLAVYGR